MLKTSSKKNNPFAKILQKIIKEDSDYDDISNKKQTTETSERKLVFAEVPNYLERPLFNHTKPMLICMFQIRMDGLCPFLLFLLHKNKRETMFNFVNFPSFDGGKDSKHLKKDAVNYMEGRLAKGDISYAGFTENETNNILILKYIDNELSVPSDEYCWASTHELINLKTITTTQSVNNPISPTVFKFFIKNHAFLLLRNEKEVIYETPVIGYYKISKGEIIDIFRKTLLKDIGSCYYFYVNRPPKNDGDDLIIRSLLFLGRMRLFGKSTNVNECDSFLLNTDDHVKMYAINNYSQHLPLSYL